MADVDLPQIRRLRVPFLGGDTPVAGVTKNDAATTLLRGLTADERSDEVDPVLDLAFEGGFFQRGWADLLSAARGEGNSDAKWGVGAGAVKSWEPSVSFDLEDADEETPPPESDPTDEIAFVCVGDPKKNGLVTKKANTCFWAFLEALESFDSSGVAAFEKAHMEQFEEAGQKPRELIRRDAPCPGVVATFSRHSPEAADYTGCGTVVLHVFDPGCWPWGNFRHVAMICAAVPNIKTHTFLRRCGYQCALQAVASNLARIVREYNRIASKADPTQPRERQLWIQADLRARVECFLSDMNCRTDKSLQQKLKEDPNGWIDVNILKGGKNADSFDAELIESLSASVLVETMMSSDGTTHLVRRAGNQPWDAKAFAKSAAAPKKPGIVGQVAGGADAWNGDWASWDGNWDGDWDGSWDGDWSGDAWYGGAAGAAAGKGEGGATSSDADGAAGGKGGKGILPEAKEGGAEPLWRQFLDAGKAAAQNVKAAAGKGGHQPKPKDPKEQARMEFISAWRQVERVTTKTALQGFQDVSVSKVVMANAPRSSDLRGAASSKQTAAMRAALGRPQAPGPTHLAPKPVAKGRITPLMNDDDDDVVDDTMNQAGSRFAIYQKQDPSASPPVTNSNPMQRPERSTPIPTVPTQQLPVSQLRRQNVVQQPAPVLRPKRLGPVGVVLEGDRPPMGSNLVRNEGGEAAEKQAKTGMNHGIISKEDAAKARNPFHGW
eukprot:TRINITY_DN123562_c0_g1_i1.p1 TRINITY_DN123562_c0_g1~~TRINITY_DN123562_c0_g1_i1.p1  ORF type:complete len:720 (-),score=143.97 TRINITY_DN123562_c0_g1_i1:113-2272(-)